MCEVRAPLGALLFCKQLQKIRYREAIFSVACVTGLYYSGQAVQNGFCPLNASNICQSSGGHAMLTAVTLKAA